ncbi:hypothetical protein EBT25_00295 [bacterium]|nr:hypothetical protein [bacterium]
MFKTQIPYLNRVKAASKEAGDSLGPFVDQQTAGEKAFLNKYLANLRDTNPVFMAKQYGSFDEGLDLVNAPGTKQIIPNTGKDPFAISGTNYLKSFLANYDQSPVLAPEDRVDPGGLTAMIQEKAEKGKEFPGSEGTSIS